MNKDQKKSVSSSHITSRDMTKRSRKKVLSVLTSVFLAIVVGFGIWYAINFHVLLPTSTLSSEILDMQSPELMENRCPQKYALYPGPNWPFPLLSPDKKYYVNISDAYFGRSKALKLFQADTNLELGSYYSKYSDLDIYCWAKDSSGIYVADFEPGSGSIFIIGGTPSKLGPVKKLLVPE